MQTRSAPSDRRTWVVALQETETSPSLARDIDPKSWSGTEGGRCSGLLLPDTLAGQRRQTFLCRYSAATHWTAHDRAYVRRAAVAVRLPFKLPRYLAITRMCRLRPTHSHSTSGIRCYHVNTAHRQQGIDNSHGVIRRQGEGDEPFG